MSRSLACAMPYNCQLTYALQRSWSRIEMGDESERRTKEPMSWACCSPRGNLMEGRSYRQAGN